MNISIKIIPHKEQRFGGVGDYWLDKKGVWQFRITNTGNQWVNFCCLMHELSEWAWALKNNISIKDIDEYDLKSKVDEPGCELDAPYHEGHELGEVVEKVLENGLKLTHKEVEKAYKPFYLFKSPKNVIMKECQHKSVSIKNGKLYCQWCPDIFANVEEWQQKRDEAIKKYHENPAKIR